MLIFIDTNILLDFYRVRGRESGIAMLDQIDRHRELIITSTQVEMEFKKNRQRVITESYKLVKSPDWAVLKPPVFLAQSKTIRGISSNQKRIDVQTRRLKKRISSVLKNPQRSDPVYKAAQRLFKSRHPWNLSRNNAERHRIRELGQKRFFLGYPPRKDADTSMGDAVNWEWIIYCAIESGDEIVIVTRDTDYGVTFDNRPVLNDWLGQEFRERVSRSRRLLLTDRLAEGFEAASIKVPRKAAEQENAFVRMLHDLGEEIDADFEGESGALRSLPPARLRLQAPPPTDEA